MQVPLRKGPLETVTKQPKADLKKHFKHHNISLKRNMFSGGCRKPCKWSNKFAQPNEALEAANHFEFSARSAYLCSLCSFTQRRCAIAAHFAPHGLSGDKLDDGWPESVEEQSLLLLVWKHYIRQYIKDV